MSGSESGISGGGEHELENSSFLFLGESANRALARSTDELHLHHHTGHSAATLSQSIERISPKSPSWVFRPESDILDPMEGSSESLLEESSLLAASDASSSLLDSSPSFVPTSRRKKKQGTNIILNYMQLQRISGNNNNRAGVDGKSMVIARSLGDGESSTSPSRYSESGSSSNNTSFASPSRPAATPTTAARATPPSRSKLLRSLNFLSDHVAAVEKRVAQKKSSATRIQRLWRGFATVSTLNAKALDKLVELDSTIARFFRCHHDESIYYSVNQSTYTRSAKMQRLQRFLGSIERISSWWQQVAQKRRQRYAVNGKWTTAQSDKVFAMVLGWRVRLLSRSEGARSISSSLGDITRVLMDILDPAASSSRWTMRTQIEAISKSVQVGSESATHPSVSSGDMLFIKKLLKQIQLNCEKYHSLFFMGSRYRSFPSPGYIDIGEAVTSLLRLSSGVADGKGFVARDGRVIAHSSSSPVGGGKRSWLSLRRDKIPADAAASVFAFAPSVISSTKNSPSEKNSPEKKSIISALRKRQQLSAGIATPNAASNYAVDANEPVAAPGHPGARAFVHLHVVSAANLMPARRGVIGGAAARIADRKPGLRVGLHLHSEASSQCKKVHSAASDWDDAALTHTLDPTWAKSFSLPLPCPRALLQSAIDGANNDINAAHKAACASLLDFWAGGYLSIQVVDGERFNQEIFLGEVTLLLSAFLVKRNNREVSGNFPLSKQQATDRVSGTLRLRAQLQLPSESLVADLMQRRICTPSPIQFTSPPETSLQMKSATTVNSGGSSSGKRSSVNRKIQILDVAKCLDGLSHVQKNTGILLGKMSNQLEARRLARSALASNASAVPNPASPDPLSSKVNDSGSTGSGTEYSSNFVDESSPSISVFDETASDAYSSIDFNAFVAREGGGGHYADDDDDVVVYSVKEKRAASSSLLSEIHNSTERLAAAMADMSAASLAENDDSVLQQDDDEDELLVDNSI